jgi:uncharacterized membrane protein YhaH (DUF805 family)
MNDWGSSMSKQVEFGEAIKLGFKKWNVMYDTASLSEYWYWYLFNVLVAVVSPFLFGLPGLVLFVPNISILVRRFKDAGTNSRLLYLWLIPPTLIIFAIASFATAGQSSNDLTGISPGYAVVAGPLFLVGLLFSTGALGIFTLVVTLKPTKTFEQGNKYAKPAQSLAPAKPATAAEFAEPAPAAKRTTKAKPAADLPDDLPTLGSE